MEKIAVIMSTYNGENFVYQQIDSILHQTGVEVDLFIRDDGSQDRTCEVLNYFSSKFPNVHYINRSENNNLGVTESFHSVLRHVLTNAPDIKFFAFADQDDFWLPEKLKAGLNKIASSQNPKGALYYSNKVFVDKELKEISKEKIVFYGDYMEILWKSLASGCTMVFNRRLLNYWAKYDVDVPCLHDAWLYRLAKCIGTDIVFDKESYILYRQHEDNVVGQKSTIMFDSSKKNIINSIKRRMQPREHSLQKIISELYRVAKDDMDEYAKSKTQVVLNYNKNFIARIKMMRFEGVSKRPIKLQMLWYNKVICNMI